MGREEAQFLGISKSQLGVAGRAFECGYGLKPCAFSDYRMFALWARKGEVFSIQVFRERQLRLAG